VPLPTPSVADSCTGLVSFTGFALLGSPKPVQKSSAMDLIAQIYIGSPTINFLYSSLRYFNEDGIIFSYGPSKLYLIQGTVGFFFASHVTMVLISCSFLDCSCAVEWIQPTVLAAGLRLRRGHSFSLQSFLVIGLGLCLDRSYTLDLHRRTAFKLNHISISIDGSHYGISQALCSTSMQTKEHSPSM